MRARPLTTTERVESGCSSSSDAPEDLSWRLNCISGFLLGCWLWSFRSWRHGPGSHLVFQLKIVLCVTPYDLRTCRSVLELYKIITISTLEIDCRSIHCVVECRSDSSQSLAGRQNDNIPRQSSDILKAVKAPFQRKYITDYQRSRPPGYPCQRIHWL